MKKEYVIILLIFFLFVGPGPNVFFLNKYTVSLFPLLSFITYLFLLRKQIKAFDFNSTLKNPEIYRWIFSGLKYCIFAHAICSLIFGNVQIPTDDLVQSYLVMPFYVVVIAPFIEEIVYRRIIFGQLQNRYNFWVGAIISSLIFSVGHLSPDRLLAYFLTGLTLCYIYKKSGTLATSILAHAILNFISLLVRTLKG